MVLKVYSYPKKLAKSVKNFLIMSKLKGNINI